MLRKPTIISGLGSALPEKIVTNNDLTHLMETTEEFIVERTGVVTRRQAPDDMSVSDLAVIAADQALSMAGLKKEDIGLVLFNTITPDHHDPGTVYFFQEKFGLNGCAAIDLRGQCAGFLYGLAMADQFVQCGTYNHVLVIGAELLSKRRDFSLKGRNLSILLGDGAGTAVVSGQNKGIFRILHFRLGADGKHAKALWTPAPGSDLGALFLAEKDIEAGRHHFQMQGGIIFKNAVEKMTMVARQVLAEANCGLDDIDWCVPHQANLRLIEAMASELGLSMDKVWTNVEKVGNTASASIPIMLHSALASGRLKSGEKILLVSFGGGLVWAGMLIEVI